MLLKKYTFYFIALMILTGIIYNIVTADKKVIEPNAVLVSNVVIR